MEEALLTMEYEGYISEFEIAIVHSKSNEVVKMLEFKVPKKKELDKKAYFHFFMPGHDHQEPPEPGAYQLKISSMKDIFGKEIIVSREVFFKLHPFR
ncbi:MAG: hypothetical protein HRU19_29845 [Pseudobacteriovorax sp.]|nr:hypothetical protein [Pseudobacteriovorax sp.]